MPQQRLFTKGFQTPWQLQDHFDDHGADFNATDELHYQFLADRFLGGSKGQTTHECTRIYYDHAIVRYDHVTQEFGVLSVNGFIQTYYIPDPRRHGMRNNYAYWRADCKRRQ